MSDHVKQHKLLYKFQSGFQTGDSTEFQILAINHYLHTEIGKQKAIRAIFLDISAAFDRVPHTLLLNKLKSYGIKGQFINIIRSYLQNRNVKIMVEGQLSNPSPDNFINCGVPQGSMLGPLLFLIYINDLPDNLNAKS